MTLQKTASAQRRGGRFGRKGMGEERTPRIICLGQAVVDCITRNIVSEDGDSAFRPSGSRDPVMMADRIELRTGGDAANEAFVLASMGVKAELMCVLGEDLAGDIVMSEAEKRGVGTDLIVRDSRISTPVADIIVRRDGSRYSVSSNAARLEGYVPDPEAVRGADILSLASIFRAPLDRPEVIRSVVTAAYRSGAVICADTKLPTFVRAGLDDLADVLPMISYIFPNEREAEHYTGKGTLPEMAEAFLKRGVGHVVIKTGADGCFAADAHGSFSLPAEPAEVVDTTGAGDNFVAGFISGLARGADLRECCRLGNLQAAKSLSHPGAV